MAPTLSTSSFSSLLIYFFPVTWQEKVIHLYPDFSLYYFFLNYYFFFLVSMYFHSVSLVAVTPPPHSGRSQSPCYHLFGGAHSPSPWCLRLYFLSEPVWNSRGMETRFTVLLLHLLGTFLATADTVSKAPVFWSETDVKTEKEASL